MDLAANEKAVHADFFNGKDAGIGVPVLIWMFLLQVMHLSNFVTSDLGHRTVKPISCAILGRQYSFYKMIAFHTTLLALAVSPVFQEKEVA